MCFFSDITFWLVKMFRVVRVVPLKMRIFLPSSILYFNIFFLLDSPDSLSKKLKKKNRQLLHVLILLISRLPWLRG